MPDLSVTATGGFPYIGADGTRPKLVLPSPDRDTPVMLCLFYSFMTNPQAWQ
jgi:hypothetical protein